MPKRKKENNEKNILLLSFAAGLIFAIVEFFYSIFSHSQSVLMDAVYDASELIFIALILFLTPLFYKPVSEKHPYGFFQVEPIFIIIKCFMMMSVTLSVSANIIESALSGGNIVNEGQISLFQLILCLVSVVIYNIMKRMNTSVCSPTVEAELLGWKIDIAYSLGLSISFFIAMFITKTEFSSAAPYVDLVIAVIIMIMMMPENIRILWKSIKDVFLFSPDDETLEKVKELSCGAMESHGFFPEFFNITKTGRHMWVSIYFSIAGNLLNLKDLDIVTEKVNSLVRKEFGNATCELIVQPEGLDIFDSTF